MRRLHILQAMGVAFFVVAIATAIGLFVQTNNDMKQKMKELGEELRQADAAT